jgi:DNA (cytosine-5)-methyltransferase 1
VLRKHWPGVPIYGDIFDIKGDEFGTVDIITGGFPCQGFSCAGKRKGREDERYLWPEMLRLIKAIRPGYILGENVSGLLTIENGRVFEEICVSLEDEGYAVQPVIVPACAVGAPHRRDRVWIACHATGNRLIGRGQTRQAQEGLQQEPEYSGELSSGFERPDRHAPDTEGNRRDSEAQSEVGREEDERGRGCGLVDSYKVAADTDIAGLQGCIETMRGQRQEPDDELPDRCGGEWHEDWYSVALRTCVRTLDDGLRGNMARPKGWRVNALKATGNSIVPQVAYQVLKGMLS